jgi:DNA-binding transcriptional LysR family regulator
MELAGIDLNLLVAFNALMDERSVTRAATRLSLRRTADIRLIEPPVALPAITETLWWHPRHSASPAHQWIRERITEIAAELDQVPSGGNTERVTGSR